MWGMRCGSREAKRRIDIVNTRKGKGKGEAGWGEKEGKEVVAAVVVARVDGMRTVARREEEERRRRVCKEGEEAWWSF